MGVMHSSQCLGVVREGSGQEFHCREACTVGARAVAPRLVLEVLAGFAAKLAVDLIRGEEPFLVGFPVQTSVHDVRRTRLIVVDMKFLPGNNDLIDQGYVVPLAHKGLYTTKPQFEVFSVDRAYGAVLCSTTTVDVEVNSDAKDAPVSLFEGTNNLLAHLIEGK